MEKPTAEAAPRNPWTLIRRVRQLVTLQGPSGPRRGFAMGEIQALTDAAILVHEGVIRETGTARRIENLTEARKALEIDAGGRLVIPAFVDPDTVLVTPGCNTARGPAPDAITVTSKKRLEGLARLSADEWVRHGVLAIGSSTGGAKDLRDARKVLTVQKGFQARPLRIRSVFTPLAGEVTAEAVRGWARAVVGKRLAGVLELEVRAAEGIGVLERIVEAAIPQGFIIRMRSDERLSRAAQELARNAGAISVSSPGVEGAPDPEFVKASCIWLLTQAQMMSGECGPQDVRRLLAEGWALALSSGYPGSGPGGYNPQYLLHVACTRLGLSIEEALTATTWNAACSLRMSAVAGSLEPGKQADLVMLDVRDYRDLVHRPGHNDVYMVLRAGKPLYRRAGLLPF